MTKQEIDQLIINLMPKFKGLILKHFFARRSQLEDYLQEAVVSAYKAISSYKEDKETLLTTYILFCVRRDLIQLSMRESKYETMVTTNNDALTKAEINNYYSDEDISYKVDKEIKLKKLKPKLTNKEYQLIDLLNQNYEFKEIEHIMKVSPNMRRVLVFKIKDKLKIN